jgi:hypothetical protein
VAPRFSARHGGRARTAVHSTREADRSAAGCSGRRPGNARAGGGERPLRRARAGRLSVSPPAPKHVDGDRVAL